MSLADFLNTPSGGGQPPSVEIAAWQGAVTSLVAFFGATLEKYDQLKLIEWRVLRAHRGVRYNATALTIQFGSNYIRLEPDDVGSMTMSCEDREHYALLSDAFVVNPPLRQIRLDYADDGKSWLYSWDIPRDDNPAALTAGALEVLVEDLLKSSVG